MKTALEILTEQINKVNNGDMRLDDNERIDSICRLSEQINNHKQREFEVKKFLHEGGVPLDKL